MGFRWTLALPMAIELGYRCIADYQTHPYDHMGFNHKTWDHIPYVFPKIVVSVFLATVTAVRTG